MPRTRYACAALALLCSATPAVAALPPADLHLDAAVERGAGGQLVVDVHMATNADGREEKVTVRAHPGEVTCRRRSPLVLPAKTAIDLLFGVRTRPRPRWDESVRFVAPRGPRLTLCGYVVSEAATRAGQPYVRRVMRVDVRLPAGAPAPPGHRRSCAAAPSLGLVRIDAHRRGSRVCTVAGRVARAWVADLRDGENPRDNWSFGWRAPGGSILRISAPRLRVSRLVVPGRAGALMCRESPAGTGPLAPLDVDCEVAGFRFNRA